MFDKSKLEVGKVVEGTVNAKYTDNDAYYNNTKIPKETLKEVAAYNNSYITKATELAAETSKEVMLKDKEVNRVVTKFPFGTKSHGNVVITVDKEKSFVNHFSDNKETVTRSNITVVASDPLFKVSKDTIKEIVNDLTNTLIK